MKILVYVSIAICFMSCEKGKQESFPGPKGVDLVLVNKDKTNLFNYETENYIDFEEIKNIHVIDGENIEQYHAHADWPKGCGIYDSEHDIGNVFGIGLSEYFDDKGLSTTIIDWGNGDSDTIVATMNPYTNLPYSEFWYNGILMKDLSKKNFSEENDDYYFEIYKDY